MRVAILLRVCVDGAHIMAVHIGIPCAQFLKPRNAVVRCGVRGAELCPKGFGLSGIAFLEAVQHNAQIVSISKVKCERVGRIFVLPARMHDQKGADFCPYPHYECEEQVDEQRCKERSQKAHAERRRKDEDKDVDDYSPNHEYRGHQKVAYLN